MRRMKPTCNLRWKEVEQSVGPNMVKRVKVLQQQWVPSDYDTYPGCYVEWREIPEAESCINDENEN